jgi:hypothetical protein
MFVEGQSPSTHIRSRFPLHLSLSAVDGASIEGEGETLIARFGYRNRPNRKMQDRKIRDNIFLSCIFLFDGREVCRRLEIRFCTFASKRIRKLPPPARTLRAPASTAPATGTAALLQRSRGRQGRRRPRHPRGFPSSCRAWPG